MADVRCPRCWAILPRHYPPCRATVAEPVHFEVGQWWPAPPLTEGGTRVVITKVDPKAGVITVRGRR